MWYHEMPLGQACAARPSLEGWARGVRRDAPCPAPPQLRDLSHRPRGWWWPRSGGGRGLDAGGHGRGHVCDWVVTAAPLRTCPEIADRTLSGARDSRLRNPGTGAPTAGPTSLSENMNRCSGNISVSARTPPGPRGPAHLSPGEVLADSERPLGAAGPRGSSAAVTHCAAQTGAPARARPVSLRGTGRCPHRARLPPALGSRAACSAGTEPHPDAGAHPSSHSPGSHCCPLTVRTKRGTWLGGGGLGASAWDPCAGLFRTPSQSPRSSA